MAVPLGRLGLGRRAGHGGRARRHDDGRLGVALGDAGVNAVLVVRAVAVNEATGPATWSSKGPTWEPSSASRPVSADGHDPAGVGVHAEMELPPGPALAWCRASRPATRPRHTASAPCCPPAGAWARYRQPASALPDRCGRGTSSVAARRLRVVWSGTARSRPSRPMTEPISPSVWRYARRNTALSVSAVRIASSEYQGCPPRVVRGSAAHASIASSREPDRQAATLPQAGVIRWPVRDLVRLSRDVVAAVLVQLEGQGGHPGSAREHSPTPPSALSPTSRPICAPRCLFGPSAGIPWPARRSGQGDLVRRTGGLQRLPADRALLFGAPAAIPAPTRHRSRQRSVHHSQWTPSSTSAAMIDVEARSARAGRPDAHFFAAWQGAFFGGLRRRAGTP